MKAIAVSDRAAGAAGMQLLERPEPKPAINDVVVQVYAAGFVGTELTWPSTWSDRLGRDRTPTIPGHELAGMVTELGYGTAGLSVGQRVLGLADWYRDGSLGELVAIEARNLAPLPDDVDFTVGASLPISGLTAWQGLFDHGRLRAGQSVIAHGAAGAVGCMVAQLAREAGAFVIGTGRAADRQKALNFGANEFVDLESERIEDVGQVDLVFDLIGGEVGKRSARLVRAGGTLVSIVGPVEEHPADGRAIDFVVEADRSQLGEIVERIRDGRLKANIGKVATLDDAVATFNSRERHTGKTVIRIRP
jgi:NADPH:quinone reductase-like Zn-dependent oxidoreductase